MEIRDKNPLINLNNYVQDSKGSQRVKSKEQKQTQNYSGDVKVNLSSQSRAITKAKEQIQKVPDIRTEKVVQLKGEINVGTYKVDGNKIAMKMIRESIIDELA